MHLLLILLLLAIAFPVIGRILGWVLSAIFWLIVLVVGLALIGILSH